MTDIKLHLKWLSLVIPYSGIPDKRYDIVLALVHLLLNLRSPRDYVRPPSSVPPFVRSRLWYFRSPVDGASVREAHCQQASTALREAHCLLN